MKKTGKGALIVAGLLLGLCGVPENGFSEDRGLTMQEAKDLLLETRNEIIFTYGYGYGREDERRFILENLYNTIHSTHSVSTTTAHAFQLCHDEITYYNWYEVDPGTGSEQ